MNASGRIEVFRPTFDTSLLIDLLPVGTVLCERRVIIGMNERFAELFGYGKQDLLGVSLERLYPNRSDFLTRGEEWLGYMNRSGEHRDERTMLRREDEPIWVRVSGRCFDRHDPYRLIACTFELAAPAAMKAVKLAPRERAIVEAMREGLTSKEIARKMNLSHRTIETYRSRLMAKTGARNAAQLLTLIH